MNKSILSLNLDRSVKSIFSLFFIAGFCLLSFLASSDLAAQGNLLIMPRRVVFEGPNKSADITLVNTGKDTARYVVSIIQLRMTKEGSLDVITTPDSGQYFADKNLRFFPRTVTLAPNESQLVKMQLTKADALAPGEYRSHVYFRAVPNINPLGDKKAESKDTSAVAIKLNPIFGITIPVIIRIGANNAKVSLSDLSFETVNDTLPRIKMTFNRTGNMSVYGDIEVNYISPQGKTTQVGVVRAVAVYTPLSSRVFQMNLEKDKGVNFKSGKLEVTYLSSGDVKPVKLAKAELILK
jgi:P pilus assembly chaperone PapD